MTFDPLDEQRRRDAEQRGREAEQRARETEQRVRDAEQRERDRAQRESDRERERAGREREREHRREERRARHEARHEFHFGHRGFDINVDVDPDEIARSVSAAFVGMDDDESESHDQTIEKTFTVDGMPRLRVQNISGETAIRVGDPGQVRVVARKRVKSVSGDVQCTDYVGSVEGSSVSGDVDIRGRVHSCELHSVSGDISIDLEPEVGGRESRLKTISGDVEVGLLNSSCVCDYHTASGDLDCEVPARIMREGRKDRTVVIGDGRSRLSVKTVSGDLTIKSASSSVHEEPGAAQDSTDSDVEAESESDHDLERTAPMASPPTAKVRDLLERRARGEVSVDEGATKLDETRRNS